MRGSFCGEAGKGVRGSANETDYVGRRTRISSLKSRWFLM